MYEFLASSLIVSIFAFNAFCMNPSSWSPPSPKNVLFGECLFVPEITGRSLSNVAYYSYRHICRQKFTENEPQPPEDKSNYWFFVGSIKNFLSQLQNMPPFNYVRIKQSLIQFTFLKDVEVEFLLKSTDRKFKIKFQSLQQCQTFYAMIYDDVELSKAAPNDIGVLHEFTTREEREIGYNVEALREKINYLWYITLRDEQGKPIHIFSQSYAAITWIKRPQTDKPQLLMQVHETFYLLTFSNCAEAKQFSDALLKFVLRLKLNSVDANLKAHFRYNKITLDSEDFNIERRRRN